MRFLCLTLLGIALVSANVRLRQSRHARPDDNMAQPLSEQPPLHDWLTAEQKAILEPIRGNPAEFKDKVQEFYKLLDGATRKEWDEKYRQECNSWLPKVLSSQELIDLKLLETTDKSAAKDKKKEYESRLDDKSKNMVNLWRDECDKLNEASRKRRELQGLDDDSVEMVFEAYSRVSRNAEPADDFISWMTDEQKKQMGELKASGSSLSDQRDKAMSFFNELPDEKKKELNEVYKGKCKAYFGKIGTPEELADIKTAHESGNTQEVGDKIKALIERQEGEEKVTALKMSTICREVFQRNKKKRDVMQKIEKHLSWLTKEQQDEIKGMVDSGVPRKEIKEKLFKYLSNVDALKKNNAKEETTKRCYAWMEEVATKEEIESLHKLHEVDHDGCKTKVREYIKRLPADRQTKVNEDLPFCEKVWYGSHDHGNHDHGNHEQHHKHHARNVHRRKRHLAAIEEYIQWLSPEDKKAVHALENTGADFDEIVDKIKELFKAQPADRQAELKNNFKNTCYKWVKEVASPEELAELKALRESGDISQLKEKVTLLEGKLDSIQKHTVEHTKDLCYSVWEVKESRMRRDHSHNLEEAFGKFLSWTTEAQKDELRKLREEGNREAVYKRVMEFFDATEGETRKKAAEELKDACKHFAVDLFGESGVNEIKAVREAGGSHDDIAAKVQTLVDGITDAGKKDRAQKFSAACAKIYRPVNRKRRDHHHSLEDFMEKYLRWTTEEQKNELNDLKTMSDDKEAIYKKVMEYFDAAEGETKKEAAEQLKGACKHYATDLFGEAGMEQIKSIKESGASKEVMIAKVQELVNGLTDETKKAKAQQLTAGCQKIYEAVPSRKRRDHEHTLEEAFEKFLSWTTDAQKEELKSLKASGDRDAVYAKVMEYFAAAEGETKQKAAEGLKGACKHFATDLFGEAGVAQIKALKESGATEETWAAKIQELVNAITDETKKVKAQKLTAGCRKVYEAVPSRKRRDHEHTLEEAFEKFLSWTTDAQKEELKSLKASGDRDAVYAKVMEYFAAAEGETKQKAAEGLKGACKHFATDLFGEAGVAQIKAVKESGADKDAMIAKIQELVNGLTDETKKAKAQKLTAGCQKVYEAVPSRKRRDHEHTLEEAFEKFLSWTTDAQKEELKSLKASGDRDAVYAKVMEYFAAAEGETKQKAAEGLKGACKHFATDLFGEAGVAQIKAVKESGADKDAMIAKIQELVNGLTDETKKAKAQKLTAGCQKVYEAVPSRKRRDHEHTLEEAFEKFLSWTTDAQKEELKSLKASGDRDAVYAKVMEYFAAAEGETKQKAAEGLKGACKHFATDLFGEAGVAQIKAVKESGADKDAMIAKIQELVNGLTDETKKAKAQKLTAGCQKVYEAVPSRKRRDHEHTLEEAFEKFLSWTTDAQKEELKSIKASGDRDAVYAKVMEYFAAAEGETKQKAAEGLKGACKHFATDLFGEAGVAQIKAVKESGADKDAMIAKIQELVNGLTDETKKAKAQKLTAGCQKVYEAVPSRKRRDHEHTLEEAFEKFLSWTTDAQKEELKSLKASGDRDAVYAKVLDYFAAAEGETKQKAAEGLKGACKHFATDLFGEAGVAQIKALKESGATEETWVAKIQELVNAITDETKKVKAQKLTAGCRKVYEAVPSRKRRDHEHTLEEAFEKFLSWTTDAQKEELKSIKASGDRDAVYAKVMEYFAAAEGETKQKAAEGLKGACKHFATDLFGEAGVAQIKAVKESGADKDAMIAKVQELVNGLTDETKKAKAQKLTAGCQKVYEAVPSRMRRDKHHNYEQEVEKYLSWLTEDQKTELSKIDKSDKKALREKILEFVDAAEGKTKIKAVTDMKAACKHYSVDIFGEAKTTELKNMKESGVSTPDLIKKLNEFIDELSDDATKEKARDLVDGCRKIYEQTRMRRDSYY